MSIEAIKWALGVDSVNPTARHVLLVMAEAANGTHRSWLSVPSICQRTGLGDRTVRRALEQLRSATLIVVAELARGTLSTSYTLAVQGGHTGSPANTAALPHRQPRPANLSASPATQAASPATQAANPKNEPYEPPSAGARATPSGASPAPEPNPDRDRMRAALRDQVRSIAKTPFPRSAPRPPATRSPDLNAALAEIEHRRLQADRLVEHSYNSDAPRPQEIISAATPPDERSISADERSLGGLTNRDKSGSGSK